MARAAAGIDDAIRKCLINGVGIHHAGLLLEERKLIEDAARARILNVLVATTTLSAGVNIHSVSRVFIMGIHRWSPAGDVAIPPAQFTQMVGRAGRSQNSNGEAFIYAKSTNSVEISRIAALCRHEIPNLVPHLASECPRFFLQCLSVGLANTTSDFVSRCFRGSESLSASVNATDQLLNDGLIVGDRPTALGRAIAGSSLEIADGLHLNRVITKMQTDLCLGDEVHLLYLCISPAVVSSLRPEPYDSAMWRYIINKHRHVIQLITGFDNKRINAMQDLPGRCGGAGRIDPAIDAEFDKIYIAVIMRELINETPIADITRKFRVDRGILQSWQMQCASFAGQIAKFCELIGAGLMAATLNRFRQRLNFGARTELLGLLVLPSCSRNTARILVRCGITSPIELADLHVEGIAALIADDGMSGEAEMDLAKKILKDAKEYTESLTRMEVMEESAMQNVT
jgi:replicative superfamily II helicase